MPAGKPTTSLGSRQGLFYHGVAKGYDEIERLFNRWPGALAATDQGAGPIDSRELREKYPGRIFL